jgi:hypothetical protein
MKKRILFLKKHFLHLKKYLIPALIILALAAVYYHTKETPCGPCNEKGIIIKKEKVPYSTEIHRNVLRAKQASAAFKATGIMPRFA